MTVISDSCLVCAGAVLRHFPAFADLVQVTSDVRSWRAGGDLALCMNCGAIQKPPTEAWRDQALRIYESYSLYHQSGGDDHVVISPESGEAEGRATRLIRRLSAEIALPSSGRLLEIGCGQGGLLRAFAPLFPTWSVEGQDLRAPAEPVRDSSGRKLIVHTGALSDVPGTFDFIIMNQVLEHVADPDSFWFSVQKKLAPGGRVVVQVPSIARNPFDLVVADHCLHFSPRTLVRALKRGGLHVEVMGDGWLNKEITLIASTRTSREAPAAYEVLESKPAARWLEQTLAWLFQTADAARLLAQDGQTFGIFGSAIAAIWLDGQTERKAYFFCDEEPTRAGRSLLGRPIVAPADLSSSSVVFMALEPSVAAVVAKRLSETTSASYVCPPPLTRDGEP